MFIPALDRAPRRCTINASYLFSVVHQVPITSHIWSFLWHAFSSSPWAEPMKFFNTHQVQLPKTAGTISVIIIREEQPSFHRRLAHLPPETSGKASLHFPGRFRHKLRTILPKELSTVPVAVIPALPHLHKPFASRLICAYLAFLLSPT